MSDQQLYPSNVPNYVLTTTGGVRLPSHEISSLKTDDLPSYYLFFVLMRLIKNNLKFKLYPYLTQKLTLEAHTRPLTHTRNIESDQITTQ
jgi:hypothetical protein